MLLCFFFDNGNVASEGAVVHGVRPRRSCHRFLAVRFMHSAKIHSYFDADLLETSLSEKLFPLLSACGVKQTGSFLGRSLDTEVLQLAGEETICALAKDHIALLLKRRHSERTGRTRMALWFERFGRRIGPL